MFEELRREAREFARRHREAFLLGALIGLAIGLGCTLIVLVIYGLTDWPPR